MTTTLDRARGVLLGGVVGDALGAGYETDKVRPGPDGPRMIGGGIGPRSPGEWTDDTAMAWCIADVAARRLDLANDEGLTAVARNFRAWFDSNPPDIGTQTQRALSGGGPYPTAAELTASAEKVARARGTSAGNGSLMRTGPVALQFLDDPDGCATAAAAISRLTHANDTAVQACVLWTEAIRTAITTGTLDIRSVLHHLPPTTPTPRGPHCSTTRNNSTHPPSGPTATSSPPCKQPGPPSTTPRKGGKAQTTYAPRSPQSSRSATTPTQPPPSPAPSSAHDGAPPPSPPTGPTPVTGTPASPATSSPTWPTTPPNHPTKNPNGLTRSARAPAVGHSGRTKRRSSRATPWRPTPSITVAAARNSRPSTGKPTWAPSPRDPEGVPRSYLRVLGQVATGGVGQSNTPPPCMRGPPD